MPDIAIIGGGVAGLTAGLYAARGGAETVVYEAMFAGGQAAKTSRIENYPGFPEGVDGFAIGALIEEQARRFGMQMEQEAVTAVDLNSRSIWLGEKKVSAGAILLCMGASPRKLGLVREEELTGRGLSYCATCDGAFFKDKDVAVIGGGDTALSDALYLARMCRSVTIVHRRQELRASAALQSAVRECANVQYALDSVCTALHGEEKLSALTLKNLISGEETTLSVSGVFVAVGVVPETLLVAGQLETEKDGSIRTDERMHTSVKGVFAAGDVRATPLRQVVTACADGAVAATEAVAFLTMQDR